MSTEETTPGAVFWQLTVDAADPATLARFWRDALGYRSTPPPGDEPWWRHYRSRLGGAAEFEDRLFDPAGLGPPLWFQAVPEAKAGKNRLHLDLYPTGRDPALAWADRVRLVEDRVAELVARGATVLARTSDDEDPDDQIHFVTLQDPEGNEFCVS